MPIPKKLLKTAFATLSDRKLRKAAQHNEIRGRETATRDELCNKLGGDDGTHLQSFTGYLTLAELKKIATLFGLDIQGQSVDNLEPAVWGFVADYDEIARGLTYDEVFSNVRAKDFPKRLNDWLTARHSVTKLSRLSPGERTIWPIRYALMDIQGNSFVGLFDRGDNHRISELTTLLTTIGAKKSAKAIIKIGEMLFDGPIPKTTKARERALICDDDAASDRLDALLSECDELWESTREDLDRLIVQFAAKSPKLFASV